MEYIQAAPSPATKGIKKDSVQKFVVQYQIPIWIYHPIIYRLQILLIGNRWETIGLASLLACDIHPPLREKVLKTHVGVKVMV